MIIEFEERFELPVEVVFPFFETPRDWAKLYGLAGELKAPVDGWHTVPLKSFPFPLVAKNTACETNRHVHWVFRGFWKGDGFVDFIPDGTGVTVKGSERISVRWLPLVSVIAEKIALEKRFRSVWAFGWRRLRKMEDARAREAQRS